MRNFMNVQRLRYVVMSLLVIVCTIGAVYYFRMLPVNNVEQDKRPTVEAKKAIFSDVFVSDDYIGRVEAINHAKILPFISGYIAEIIVSGGQKVEKDETLAILRQEEYAAALAAAEAQLFSAKADFLNAKIKHERTQKAGAKAISRQQADDAKAAYLVAEGNLEKAKADKAQAKVNFDYTVLKAPFSGVIGNIDTSIGDFVSPQTASLMQIVQYNPIRVVFSVTDKEYPRLFDLLFNKKSAKIKVQLADGQLLKNIGTNIYTANLVDEKTNSVAVYAEFENSENKLFPNAYVKVLVEKNYENALLVAKDIVDMQEDGYYIYVIEDEKIKLHKLAILDEKDSNYVVANNFAPNVLLPTEILSQEMLGLRVSPQIKNGDK